LRDTPSDVRSTPPRRDPELATGTFLVVPEDERDWGLRLRLPLSIGWTEFDLGSGISFDQLTTVSLVPTAELVVPLDDRWTLLPFIGLGAAWLNGDTELAGGSDTLGLATGGVRAQLWQPLDERYVLAFSTQLRYDVAMTSRNGVLGDWGSFDAALELRRTLGAPREGPRFQPGLYVLATHYWDPVEVEIDGITPGSADNQKELGLSIGSDVPFEILGFTVPRVFLGISSGGDLKSVRIRFGRL